MVNQLVLHYAHYPDSCPQPCQPLEPLFLILDVHSVPLIQSPHRYAKMKRLNYVPDG